MIDVATITAIPLFEGLPPDELERVAGWLEPIDVPAEWHLLNQGSYPDGFFVVLEGTVRIERDGDLIAELGPGQFFGELALMRPDAIRTARVRAKTPLRCLALDRASFRGLVATNPEVAASLLEVALGRLAENAGVEDDRPG